MRRTTTHTILVVALGLGLTACTGDDPEATTKPAIKTTVETPAPSTPPPAPKAAGIGDTVTLKGYNDGEQIAATLKKVSDPAVPKTSFSGPGSGKRWIAYEFEIVNTGPALYEGAAIIGMEIADSDGRRFDGVVGEVKAGPRMAFGTTLWPGEKTLGWLVFEAPEKSKIATVLMGGGYSDQEGRWKLP